MLNDRNDMKKIFNIFAAALMSAAVLTSCAEKEIVTYYPDEVVIPALQELSVEEGLQLSDGDGVIFATLQFSAADFGIALPQLQGTRHTPISRRISPPSRHLAM